MEHLPCAQNITIMKEIINDFKAVWNDKHERKEFIGGTVCVIAMFALTYFWLLIASAIQNY